MNEKKKKRKTSLDLEMDWAKKRRRKIEKPHTSEQQTTEWTQAHGNGQTDWSAHLLVSAYVIISDVKFMISLPGTVQSVHCN